MLIFKKHNSHGFTLLEILLVIGIIAILAGIVIVAINPSKQLAVVRNTQRKSDLKQIYNAITQYYIDNSAFPSTISTTTLNEVCNTGSVAATTTALNGASCGTLANLSVLVPTYLTAIPTDPTGTSSLLSFIPTAYAATTATGTGYKVGINTAKQVLISAPLAELGVTVTVGNVPVSDTVASTLGVGLVAHYKMNDTDGTTVVDSTSNGYDGTGTYTANPSGKINAALSFNGTSDYVNMGNILNMGTSDFSMSAWMKTTSTGQQRIFSKEVWGGGGYALMSWEGNYAAIVGSPGYVAPYEWIYIGSIPVKDGNWHLITVTMDRDGYAKLYVDGVQDGVGLDISANASNNINNNLDLLVGDSVAHTEKFNGGLDDIRIYNRILSSSEITQLYNGTAGTEAE
jgi:prepilin-type N-terminal cleavage/methylation domain-containing protein